jgi:hypothetical protein
MDAITMITASVPGQVFQNRAQPDGTGSKAFNIIQLLPDTGKTATLIKTIVWIVIGNMHRFRYRLIETVHHDKINDMVPPIGGEGKRVFAVPATCSALSKTACTSGEKTEVNMVPVQFYLQLK